MPRAIEILIMRKARHPNLQFRLRHAGRIALAVSAITAISLGAILYYLGAGGSSDSYLAHLSHVATTHRQLGPALLVASGVLLAVTGLLTWLMAVYANHRVAGPLYRFACNVDEAMATDGGGHVPIRRNDHLQDEARLLERTVSAVQEHEDELLRLCAQASDALNSGDIEDYSRQVDALRGKADQARLADE